MTTYLHLVRCGVKRSQNRPYDNETDARISSATNAIRRVDGAARPLPPYLHALDFDDTYPDDAAWYYAQPQGYGSCSARRLGGFLERNYDWKFNDMAEFVVRGVKRSQNRPYDNVDVYVFDLDPTSIKDGSFILGGEYSRANMSIVGELCSVRVYAKALTKEEVLHNFRCKTVTK